MAWLGQISKAETASVPHRWIDEEIDRICSVIKMVEYVTPNYFAELLGVDGRTVRMWLLIRDLPIVKENKGKKIWYKIGPDTAIREWFNLNRNCLARKYIRDRKGT